MACLPCEKAEKSAEKMYQLIKWATEFAKDDATLTGNKSYKIVKLPNGSISWQRSDDHANHETIQFLYFD